MKKLCLALIGLAFGGMASAISIGWQWSALDASLVNGSSYYMVYTTNGDLTAEQAVAAASGGAYNGIGTTWGSTLNTSGMSVDGATVIPGTGDTVTSVQVDSNGSDVMLSFVNTSENGFNLSPTSDGETGYLYLVIFNDANIGDASQFAVAKAPGTVQVNDKGQVVQGGRIPDDLEFQAPVWMGGTHRAAPEPTALALLALGIAGVALRRRVR